MTDLISRLRDTPNWMRESYGSWKDCVLKYDRAPFEAADEIEHQKRCVENISRCWKDKCDEIEHQQLCIRDLNGSLNEKRDEIERLRAALTDIAQHQDSEWPLRCQMNVRTARAALKEPT